MKKIYSLPSSLQKLCSHESILSQAFPRLTGEHGLQLKTEYWRQKGSASRGDSDQHFPPLLFFHWDEPFHLNSPQNFQGEMVSAPYENLTATAVDTLLQGTPCYKGNYWALTIISMEHPERSVIRDHSNHGRSNEPMNRCPEWIHRFIWLATMIRASSDHWSWSASSQRTKLTVELVWHNVLR